jgi:hypothetical protein
MKKIIITGAPRTGTTALANILSQFSNILITNESGLFDYNPNNYINRKNTFLKRNKTNIIFLNQKNLTMDDVDDFYNGNYKNKGNIQFFGDKFPTYCTDRMYCSHLSKKHNDAYFIFTYRNPCATIYSGLYRSKIENNSTHTDWFFKNIQDSTEKFINYNLNWSMYMFPYIKNKFIVNYDYYINNVDLLIKDLSVFLNTPLNIKDLENKQAICNSVDVGFEENRSLYSNSKLEEYKNEFSKEQIDFINYQTKPINEYIKNLIIKQKSKCYKNRKFFVN